ncbi:hypothetical protein FACS1894199_04390 [Bacteroidia bacterium]|nr:hypothetical protein FACS1894199_04390 [Bacteroidia bacterium]
MKNVIKVSIGNIAFTLEEEAYKALSDYLKEVQEHYKSHTNGNEIIEGIEERIADLLSERVQVEAVVSVSVINDIIHVLGRTDDIDQETENEAGDSEKSEKKTRKLYRNPDDKIIGGVLGGIAVYLKIDATFLRIGYVLVTIFSWSFIKIHHFPFGFFFSIPFLVLLYILLWLIIPKAKTVKQRCAMHGESLNIENIEKNLEDFSTRISDAVKDTAGFWHLLGNIISKALGSILVVGGIAGIVTCTVLTISFLSWNLGNNILPIFFTSPLAIYFLKIFVTLTLFLPFIWMLYTGIQLLFGFKSPKWRPALCLFLLWVLSLIASIALTVSMMLPYRNMNGEYAKMEMEARDTIYIRYINIEQWKGSSVFMEQNPYRCDLVCVSNSREGDARVAIYPSLNLHRDNRSEFCLHLDAKRMNNISPWDEYRNAKVNDFCQIKGDTLFLSPIVLEKSKPVREISRHIAIEIGKETEVILLEPYHTFKNSVRHNDFGFLFR